MTFHVCFDPCKPKYFNMMSWLTQNLTVCGSEGRLDLIEQWVFMSDQAWTKQEIHLCILQYWKPHQVLKAIGASVIMFQQHSSRAMQWGQGDMNIQSYVM